MRFGWYCRPDQAGKKAFNPDIAKSAPGILDFRSISFQVELC